MSGGHSRRIALPGGGSLYVVMEDVAWMQFGEDERQLMSAIADAMQAYEAKRRSEQLKADDAVGQTPSNPI
jgi:hypothetical protein